MLRPTIWTTDIDSLVSGRVHVMCPTACSHSKREKQLWQQSVSVTDGDDRSRMLKKASNGRRRT